MQVIPGKSVTNRPAIDKSGFLTNVAASCNHLMIFRNASSTALIKLYMQVMLTKQAELLAANEYYHKQNERLNIQNERLVMGIIVSNVKIDSNNTEFRAHAYVRIYFLARLECSA
jgi:hypothetical protein